MNELDAACPRGELARVGAGVGDPPQCPAMLVRGLAAVALALLVAFGVAGETETLLAVVVVGVIDPVVLLN